MMSQGSMLEDELPRLSGRPLTHGEEFEAARSQAEQLWVSKRKRRRELARLSIEKKAEIVVQLQRAVHKIGPSREHRHLVPWRLP